MSAYVSPRMYPLRQHMSAYVSICQHTSARQHTSAYVSIRQHTSAYVSTAARQHTSAYVSICQYTSAYLSVCQHTSACVSPRVYPLHILWQVAAWTKVLESGQWERSQTKQFYIKNKNNNHKAHFLLESTTKGSKNFFPPSFSFSFSFSPLFLLC
jgi:hypothetical protein